MFSAIRQGDPKRTLISIEDWLVKHQASTPLCPLCSAIVSIKSALSRIVDPHFAHPPGSICPIVQKSGNLPTLLKTMPRGPQVSTNQIKQTTLDYLEKVRYAASKLCKLLSWDEMIELLTRANQLNAWSLQGLDIEFVPYLLLCCKEDVFPAKLGNQRPNPTFFVLEPMSVSAGYWGKTYQSKRYIWQIEHAKNGTIIKRKDIVAPSIISQWYIANAEQALGLSRSHPY